MVVGLDSLWEAGEVLGLLGNFLIIRRDAFMERSSLVNMMIMNPIL